MMGTCQFCNLANGIEFANIVFIKPIMFASAPLSMALKECYSPDGISIMQNGGYFHDANHYHMHVFPRYKNDGFGWTDPQRPQKKLATASQVATHANMGSGLEIVKK